MIHTVGHRLPYFRSYTGNLRKILTDFLHDLKLAPIELSRYNFNLACIHTGGMFVQLGTSGPACGGNHFTRAMERFLDNSSNAIRLLQGRSRRQRNVDMEGSLVELQQQLAADQSKKHHREDQHHRGNADNFSRLMQRPLKDSRVMPLQPLHKLRGAGFATQTCTAKQVVAQSWCYRHRTEK